MKKIAVFGLSGNPPGLHHRQIVKSLTKYFDQVIVVPCGPRPDKPVTNDIPAIHRATMADLTFGNLPKVRIDLDDLESSIFTNHYLLNRRYAQEGEVWLVVGADLVRGGRSGRSLIQTEWQNGQELWQTAKFAVVTRLDCPSILADLPPQARLFDFKIKGSSTIIREKVFRHEPIVNLVTDQVADYIERYALYRGMLPVESSLNFAIAEPRVIIHADKNNPSALAIAAYFKPLQDLKNPNLILVIGGDGSFLKAVNKYWRKRLPFCGINAGHVGFLSNNFEAIKDHGFNGLIIRQSPMLYVEAAGSDGRILTSLAFNDAWVERVKAGQAVWMEVRVNGGSVINKLVADGALVCTAAGSTAYALGMGATPLRVGAKEILLVGSNVYSPLYWKSAQLAPDTVVELVNLAAKYRPLQALVDGQPLVRRTERMLIRVSNIAAAELAFLPEHDIRGKVLKLQFPRTV